MAAASFSLIMDTRRAVAEVLGECPRCGALSSQVLELAWCAKAIICRECLAAIPLDGEILRALRAQPVDATTAIDLLTRVSGASANS
jgi:hypothetical protein